MVGINLVDIFGRSNDKMVLVNRVHTKRLDEIFIYTEQTNFWFESERVGFGRSVVGNFC